MTITKPDWSVPLLLEQPVALVASEHCFNHELHSPDPDSATSKCSKRIVVGGNLRDMAVRKRLGPPASA